MTAASSSSVRVALRVRPLTEQEKQQYQHNAIKFIPSNQQQIVLDGDRSFTFDYVYTPTADQEQVYSTSVVPLLNKFMEGYNSTILAYGQTGSGKTYSMGIGLDNNDGIVPRFIDSLFKGLNANKSPNYSFQVCVSFLELHNEDLVDLLCVNRRRGSSSNDFINNLTIREDSQGNICWSGVKEEVVHTPHELMGLLQKGSIARTTASTDMNNTSSRSHAIFSIILKQQYILSTSSYNENDSNVQENAANKLLHRSPSNQTLVNCSPEVKRLVSKFHFVDLAGSERLKRTNAVGDRAKEGISINTGLLALGNVISALGDESRRVSHIPYRDSKLTRLLQDSLGGNSQTLMLACASPSDANLQETLNTLKYANRARNIRNRVIINQEMGESERLKATITRLKEELRGTDDFLCAVNDEMDSLKTQVGSLSQQLTRTAEELALTKYERDTFKHQLSLGSTAAAIDNDVNASLMIEYAKTIETLRIELLQSQQQQHPTTKSSSLQIDHVDSSATLVASPHHSSTISQQPHESPSLAEKYDHNSRKKKKNHSYRFGSKRSKSLRRRSITSLNSSNNNSTNTSPKQNRASLSQLFPQDKILHDAKRSIQKETEFLQSAKVISIASSTFWNSNNKEDIHQQSKNLQYRRRTVDITPPISVASDHMNENKRLLQKLSTLIESKHLVVRQLEKSEKSRLDQSQQLNRKISDLNSKRTTVIAQHKKELSDLRNGYETRIKKQQVELQALRRKHMQLISKADGIRNQQQSVMDQLQRNIEKLAHEKKKLIKRLKLESDRAREKQHENEKELSKSKRQEAQLVSVKKRLERELMQQKVASKRATEEIVALGGQMKQIAALIKKVMGSSKTGGLAATDSRNLLAKAAACANVRGYLVKQSSATKKVGGKFKVTTLQQHVYQKKRLIHRAISLYVKGQSSSKIGQELIQKRDRLIQEQKELLSERQVILQQENIPLNALEPQYMDERIDLITVKVDTLNQQIQRLLATEQQQQQEQHEEDDNNWMDIIDKELFISMTDASPQVAYEIALSLIRSLEPVEARLVSESLLEDIIQLKSDQQYNTTSISHLTAMLNSLQIGLVQMRRVGNASSDMEEEESDGDFEEEVFTPSTSCTDSTTQQITKIAASKSASLLDTLFIKILSSPVNIKCGLVLPK